MRPINESTKIARAMYVMPSTIQRRTSSSAQSHPLERSIGKYVSTQYKKTNMMVIMTTRKIEKLVNTSGMKSATMLRAARAAPPHCMT